MHVPINRFSAAIFHLLISALVVSIIAGAVFFIWYPDLLAYASGVGVIFLILIIVDVVLGPLITLIVFNLKKKEIKRDLFVLILIQVMALSYGVWVLFNARPVFVVFNFDRFDVVYANEFSPARLEQLKHSEFGGLPILGPKIIGARLPSHSKKANEIVRRAIVGNDDVQYMPELYLNYQNVVVDVVKQVKDLVALYRFNKSERDNVDGLINQFSSVSDKIGYVPLKGRVNDLVVVVDRTNGELIKYSKLKPLSYTYGTDLVDLKKKNSKN